MTLPKNRHFSTLAGRSPEQHDEEQAAALNLLAPLTRGPVGLPSPSESAQAREALLPWLQQQVAQVPAKRAEIHERAARLKARRSAWTALLVAAAAAALIGWVILPSSTEQTSQAASPLLDLQPNSAARDEENGEFITLVTGSVQSGSVDVLSGSRLGLSSRLVTNAQQGASLRGSSGFEVEMAPQSTITLLGDRADASPSRQLAHQSAALKDARLLGASSKQTRLFLAQGSASFAVPPLASGSTLQVLTADAAVTVLGTRFEVIKENEQTCVRVSEGRVLVARGEQHRILAAGQSWGCSADTSTQSNATSSSGESIDKAGSVDLKSAHAPHSPRSPHSRAADRGASSAVVPSDNSAPTTTLAAESALLSEALSAESHQRWQAATLTYQRLLTRYPRSVFAPEARAGLTRMRSRRP